MRSMGRYWRTLRHLTGRQVFFQVWYRLSKGFYQSGFTQPMSELMPSYRHVPMTFTFLNQTVSFTKNIDWNYARNGKLWTYHLNYFDVLNEPETTAETGLALIHNFIDQYTRLRDGLEPYPTSLRLMNWIRFLCRNQMQDQHINVYLLRQTRLLRYRLEYHLGGNHLLENGFALLVASIYLRQERWQKKAIRLIRAELQEQILPDGGHYERSPAYHRDLLVRLHYILEFMSVTPDISDASFISFVEQKVTQMQRWLNSVTFRNGDLPMLNDGISPGKAGAIDSLEGGTKTYRMFRQPRYELLADVGAVGPDHQPGHAHADSLSFLLHVDNKPVLVDTGTSTYESGQRRQYERSTAAHNTVEVAGQNSSEVWAVFRVGRRARTKVLAHTAITLTAQHDGYRHIGLVHERSWMVDPNRIRLTDRLLGNPVEGPSKHIARFYAHPDVTIQLTDTGATLGPTEWVLSSSNPILFRLVSCEIADGFNQLRTSTCLEVNFTADLVTQIHL